MFAQDFRDVSACGIRTEKVSGVHLCSGSASATDFAVLAYATFSLQIITVPELEG